MSVVAVAIKNQDAVWLAKAKRDGFFVDLITGKSNAVVRVDYSCVMHASRAHVFGFFFSIRRRHTRYIGDCSSDVCSSDLVTSSTRMIGPANSDWSVTGCSMTGP